MESRDLLHELERKVQELQAFNDIGRTLAGTLDIHEVLALIMQKVSEVLRPGHWSLLLVDEAKQDLVFEIAVGEGAERLKSMRLPIGEGVAGSVAATASRCSSPTSGPTRASRPASTTPRASSPAACSPCRCAPRGGCSAWSSS